MKQTDSQMPGEINVIGTVLGDDKQQLWAVADTSLKHDGEVARTFQFRESFKLETDNGNVIQIDPQRATLDGKTAHTVKGAWKDLAPRFQALCPGFSAGPHLPVELKVIGFRSNERVAVRGVVQAQTRVPGHTYRENSSEAFPSHVQALSIANANTHEPISTAQRSTLRVPVRWLILSTLIGLGCLVTAAISLFHSPQGVIEAAIRIGWLSFASVLLWQTSAYWIGQPHITHGGLTYRHLPSFHTMQEDRKYTIMGTYSTLGISSILFIFTSIPPGISLLMPELFGIWNDGSLQGPQYVAWLPPAVLTLVLLFENHRQTRQSRRIATTMIGTPQYRGNPGWQSIRARFSNSEPWTHVVSTRKEQSFRKTNLIVQTSSQHPQQTEMDSEHGRFILRTSQAALGTTQWHYEKLENGSSKLGFVGITAGEALIVANFNLPLADIQNVGPESLLIVTTNRNRSPKTWLLVRVWMNRAGWLLPIIASGLIAVRWLLAQVISG